MVFLLALHTELGYISSEMKKGMKGTAWKFQIMFANFFHIPFIEIEVLCPLFLKVNILL